ncbi:hypothetical protein N7520_003518 [Penicillium odoratum]|uniref:uncharacterized protein n=1 Tax=Penicillium odoratum TaxID=1167516 RepID=UPI002548F90E|nr:uncharacterized protein N7520_003518 [Penicillium odoratum]KAJ5768959.1 hypothetical protein N7520_003518 [Penicillium odoratum]
MTEPPAKRPRRVDSTTMWDMNDSQTHPTDSGAEVDHRRSPQPRGSREDRRYRSRSRDRKNTRRERSWSRDRRDHDRRDIRDRDGRGPRDGKRSNSRDRGQDRRAPTSKYDKFRDRSRSRSPAGNGNQTRSPQPRGNKDDRRSGRREPRFQADGRKANGAFIKGDEMDVDFKEDADEDEMEAMMRKAMGFSRFRSTKNTKVPGNDIYGVRKEKKTEYRQYMNRTGGFNRPLSPSR